MQSIAKKITIRAARLKFVQMLPLLEHKALGPKWSQVTQLGLLTKPQLIRGLTKVSSEKNAVGNVTGGVNRLSPEMPRSPMLIKHCPGHLNQSAVLALNHTVLWGSVRSRILVIKNLVTAKGIKMRVFEFSSIVRANCSHPTIVLVLQPQDQIMNKLKHLILRL